MQKHDLDYDKLLTHLNEKWKNNPCPMCQTATWSTPAKIFEIREFSGGSLVVGGVPIIPIIPVTCQNCGNTIFINAITSNLLIDKTNPE